MRVQTGVFFAAGIVIMIIGCACRSGNVNTSAPKRAILRFKHTSKNGKVSFCQTKHTILRVEHACRNENVNIPSMKRMRSKLKMLSCFGKKM